jgi:hypothetical protein
MAAMNGGFQRGFASDLLICVMTAGRADFAKQYAFHAAGIP